MAKNPSRRLAVLLHADVVGSTTLVQLNELIAHERIREAFLRFSEIIANYSGTAHEIRGDALVAEFSRASDAVSAALWFQDANTAHNKNITDEIRPVLRVGVSMGEVVIADNAVTGGGIVLAQRLEQLAEPGGVCIQGAVYETLPNRLPFQFENLGEQQVKGFDEPVKVYAVSLITGSEIPEPEALVQPDTAPLELPDKPSIAVLPFTNMSGDPEQEYFSDGITEDIITELSRFSMLFVIARHSSFAFKGEKVGIKEIGEKLGVQYVVEGSVRKAENRVRISAQLIETETGNHLWAERYDRELTDIFAVQDEVTQNIVAMLPSHVERAIAERAARKPTENMKAYEYLLQGNIHFHRQSPDEIRKARQLYERAIELDPRFSQGHARLGDTHNVDSFQGWGTEESPSLALRHARTSVELDPEDCFARQVLVFAYLKRGLWEEAEGQLDIALRLNPNDAENLMWAGEASTILGRHHEAVALYKQAMRLDPMHPNFYRELFGRVLYCLRDYQRAVQALVGGGATWAFGHAYLAAAYGKLGERTKAEDELAQFASRRQEELESIGISPAEGVLQLVQHMSTYYCRGEDWEHFIEGLREAGLPD